MSPLLVLVTTAALGVEVGWQPLAGGGHEYTIQIEPQLLDLLARGTDEIASDVPEGIDVRRYRVIVGTGRLPRDAGAAARRAAEPRRASPPASSPASPPGSPVAESQGPGPADDPFDAPPLEVSGADDRSAEVGPGPEAPETDRDAARARPDVESTADDTGAEWPSRPPAKLPAAPAPAAPIQATFDDRGGAGAAEGDEREAQKPQLPAGAGRPWFPLTASVVLLCCSLGANFYLGWIAWDARKRFRDRVAQLRPAS